jgi:hypothetical protein
MHSLSFLTLDIWKNSMQCLLKSCEVQNFTLVKRLLYVSKDSNTFPVNLKMLFLPKVLVLFKNPNQMLIWNFVTMSACRKGKNPRGLVLAGPGDDTSYTAGSAGPAGPLLSMSDQGFTFRIQLLSGGGGGSVNSPNSSTLFFTHYKQLYLYILSPTTKLFNTK